MSLSNTLITECEYLLVPVVRLRIWGSQVFEPLNTISSIDDFNVLLVLAVGTPLPLAFCGADID